MGKSFSFKGEMDPTLTESCLKKIVYKSIKNNVKKIVNKGEHRQRAIRWFSFDQRKKKKKH